ncbi:MAG: elongation factor G [Erysipelotrichia bacterium]|jgi:elongation factor G|nr:elongation factor G [Erysipelotrichia bacterium]
MRDYQSFEVRNVVTLGHSGSGKTTLVESMLLHTKAVDRIGKAVDGNSVLDYDAEEVKRGVSVFTSLAPIEVRNTKINMLDTPGYLDYIGEATAGLAVADNALIVVGAKDGVQSGTLTGYKKAKERKLPTIFFVNKLDEENTSFDQTYNQLREAFGKAVIAFELPIMEGGHIVGSINVLKNKAWYINDRENAKPIPDAYVARVNELKEQISEAVAMSDDTLMEKFFEGESFTDAEILKGIRLGVRSGEILPVYSGSATKVIGVERLLELIVDYFPTYAEKGFVEAKDEKGNIVQLQTSETESFSARIFKTIVDPFVGRISFIKVMSGVITTDSIVHNAQKDKAEKVNQLFLIKGKNQIGVGKLFAGDIGAIVKLQMSETNDTLCTKAKIVTFDPIEFVQPMLGFALWPKTKLDEDKMSTSLQRLLEEDPTLRMDKNPETHELVLYGVGDQHIDVIISKLKSKYKVEVDLSEPKVPYRETILGTVTAEGKHKKQSGGAGQFGHVFITFEPSESSDMVFEEKIFGGAVPRQYFPAVEAGLREAMVKGVLAGYKVVGVKATLVDGKYHDVDSKEIAFKQAAKLAYRAGMPKARPVLLEPIVKVAVTVPEEYTGTVIGDLNKRRGIILGMEMISENEQLVSAEVPMSEMMRYPTELRSFTQGRGSFVQEFDRYEVAPPPIAQKVIDSAVKEADEEE